MRSMINMIRSLVALVMLMAFCGTAFAQSESAAPVKERKAKLNFEDELVEGGTQKPELFYLFQKKNFNYKRLIKLRENFLPEMRRSTEDIQRVRGAN